MITYFVKIHNVQVYSLYLFQLILIQPLPYISIPLFQECINLLILHFMLFLPLITSTSTTLTRHNETSLKRYNILSFRLSCVRAIVLSLIESILVLMHL